MCHDHTPPLPLNPCDTDFNRVPRLRITKDMLKRMECSIDNNTVTTQGKAYKPAELTLGFVYNRDVLKEDSRELDELIAKTINRHPNRRK